MSDMFFDFKEAINKVKENVVQSGEEYERMCEDVYSAYPAFRDEWMKRLGYERKPWTEKYVIDEKDEFYMFKKKYNYFLSFANGCIKAQEDLIDKRAMKIVMTHAVGEFIIPGYKKNPVTLDCAEMSCAIDFLWDSYKEEDPFDYYCRHNSTENANEDIGKMIFYKKWYDERDSHWATPEEIKKAQKEMREQHIRQRANDALWRAYKERHPLTNMSDLL